jgi:hypothetical protein
MLLSIADAEPALLETSLKFHASIKLDIIYFFDKTIYYSTYIKVDLENTRGSKKTVKNVKG